MSFSPCSEDSETPRRRTAFGSGILSSNRLIAICARSSRLAIAEETDRLRVIISKSTNFTLSVTVRPRVPADSQCRQILSISGSSSAAKPASVPPNWVFRVAWTVLYIMIAVARAGRRGASYSGPFERDPSRDLD